MRFSRVVVAEVSLRVRERQVVALVVQAEEGLEVDSVPTRRGQVAL